MPIPSTPPPQVIDWYAVYAAAFGNPYRGEPKVCIVSSRYGGCYEGGRFVAINVEDLESAAFEDDVSAAHWWFAHERLTGAGNTPDEALLDWYHKRQAKQ